MDPPGADEFNQFDEETLDAGDLVSDLTRWLATARVDAAAASRARERWLRQQLTEEATVAGVLLELAENTATVALQCVGGRRHHGTLRAVGDDFLALRTTSGTDVIIALAALVAVHPVDGSRSTFAGSRPAALDMSLVDALAALVADRPRVLLTIGDGSTVVGELQSVGRDVAVLQPDGGAAATYVATANITEFTIA